MTAQTPRVIEFDDIREGDRIEAAWSVGDREDACRGVAAYTSGYGTWCTEEGMLLAERRAAGTITLLHRPTVAEPTGLGAVVRATLRKGSRRQGVFVRSHPGPYGHVWRGLDDGWDWPAFDPDSIEVLSEGIEVES